MSEEEDVRNVIESIIDERLKKISGNNGSGLDIGDFSKFVNAMKTTKEALTSPIEEAINKNVTDKLVNQIIPGMTQPSKSSFLDSNMMTAFGAKLGENVPVIIDVVVKNFGPERAGQFIDKFTQQRTIGAGNVNQQSGQQSVDEHILSMNSDDPAHLHQYMSFRNINDIEIAKKMLNLEKDKLLSKLKSQSSSLHQFDVSNVNDVNQPERGHDSGSSNLEKLIEEQNNAVKSIIDNLQKKDEAISQMFNEINQLKQKLSVSSNVPVSEKIVMDEGDINSEFHKPDIDSELRGIDSEFHNPNIDSELRSIDSKSRKKELNTSEKFKLRLERDKVEKVVKVEKNKDITNSEYVDYKDIKNEQKIEENLIKSNEEIIISKKKKSTPIF